MRHGKLTINELNNFVLNQIKIKRQETLLPPAIGEDCAAISCDDILLVTSDPITCSEDTVNLGKLAIEVGCNDILVNGGEPIAITFTVLLPTDFDVALLRDLMANAEQAAYENNIDIIGGHTEFTDSVNRPIVSATTLGRTKNIIRKKTLRRGSKLYVTKSLGMEGTVLLAKNKKVSNALSSSDRAKIAEIENSLSIRKEAKILAQNNVDIMHDITEGGVYGAVAELCSGGGYGATIYDNLLPVAQVTKKVCELVNANPFKLISSGSILFSCEDNEKLMNELKAANIEVTFIGEISESLEAIVVHDLNINEELSVETDEIYKFLGVKTDL